MNAKHTPGPWHIEVKHLTEGAFTLSHGVNGYGDGPAGDVAKIYTSEANALLIAAAPELLEACETFAEWLRREDEGFIKAGKSRDTPEGEKEWSAWYYENLRICALANSQAISAIAKARGEA